MFFNDFSITLLIPFWICFWKFDESISDVFFKMFNIGFKQTVQQSSYNHGFLQITLSRKDVNFMNFRMVLHMIFLIFAVTCFCIDFRCVLALISTPIQELCSIHFHVFGFPFFSYFFWMVIFLTFRDLRTKNGSQKSPPWFRQHTPKPTFGALRR